MASNDNSPSRLLLDGVRKDLATEDSAAVKRARMGIIVRVALIVLVAVYMSWVSRSISRVDAPALTRIAAVSLEDRLPTMRRELRDYAVSMAPALTDQARRLMLDLPERTREYLEAKLMSQADALIARFEVDIDAAIGVVLDDQIALVKQQLPGMTPEQQLDAIVLGVSAVFHDTMQEALDELYLEYSKEVRRLNAELEHLSAGENLTEAEMIDKQLIEAWMVLAHKYRVTDPGALIAGR